MLALRRSPSGRVVLAVGLLGFVGAACAKATPIGGTGGTTGSGSGGAGTGTATGGAGPGSGGAGPATGSGGAGPGTGSGGADPGSGSGGSASGGAGMDARGTVVDAATDRVCQEAELNWEPKIPTVYLMVDRSGSMFDCISTAGNVEPSCKTPTDTPWAKLKDAALSVVTSLQAQVRFGFASFTGTNPMSGGMCPIINKVAPALNNATAISTLYNSLPFQPETTEVGKKFETPARQSLDMIGNELGADTTPGDKYILFITDGQPDYCDDSNTLCAPDSVIGGLQALKKKNITTIIMGLKSTVNDLAPGILEAFANAGAGEPTLAPIKANQDMFALYDQCNSIAGWRADFVTTGKMAERGMTIGDYATTAGPTKPYAPDITNQTMLVSQLSQALAGVKSCVFDLGDVNGKSLKVDLMQLDKATISVMGTTVPISDTNGWRMNSATQLELTGTACATWRKPETTTIKFGFPCQIVIIE